MSGTVIKYGTTRLKVLLESENIDLADRKILKAAGDREIPLPIFG